MRARGSRSSATFRASISRARSTADPTTGRSGAGTASERAQTSNKPSSSRLGLLDRRDRVRGHQRHCSDRRTDLSRADLAPPARLPNVDHDQPVPAVARSVDHVQQARTVQRGAVQRGQPVQADNATAALAPAPAPAPAPAIRANSSIRSSLRGGGA
jgi:hypothetical protein